MPAVRGSSSRCAVCPRLRVANSSRTTVSPARRADLLGSSGEGVRRRTLRRWRREHLRQKSLTQPAVLRTLQSYWQPAAKMVAGMEPSVRRILASRAVTNALLCTISSGVMKSAGRDSRHRGAGFPLPRWMGTPGTGTGAGTGAGTSTTPGHTLQRARFARRGVARYDTAVSPAVYLDVCCLKRPFDDATHLGFAEQAQAQWFVTTDYRLLKRGRMHAGRLRVAVTGPIELPLPGLGDEA